MEGLLINLLLLAVFVILAGWIINKFITDATFRNVAFLIVAVLALIWLFQIFRGAGAGIRVGDVSQYLTMLT